FGDADRSVVGLIQLMLLICLVMIGLQAELGWFYYAGIFIAATLAVYQQGLIRYREREACFRAFLNNNWFGAAVFMGMLLDYMFLG
ncbi:MAG: 4-hydroxybenzoate octaprenyltransferase, partial [Gammaproteobacteria bacterium]|nr:4-hydroxybenzoate octaprenyltransferase [Gammaproteobacteria bacterium]